MQGYMSEKGKNLATHEDIDKLVEQVSAVTQTAKEIEAKISDQVWDRQRRWELKRDHILLVAERCANTKDTLMSLDGRMERIATEQAEGLQTDSLSFQVIADSFDDALNDLDKVTMIARIILKQETASTIAELATFTRGLGVEILRGNNGALHNQMEELAKRHFAVNEAIRNELDHP